MQEWYITSQCEQSSHVMTRGLWYASGPRVTNTCILGGKRKMMGHLQDLGVDWRIINECRLYCILTNIPSPLD